MDDLTNKSTLVSIYYLEKVIIENDSIQMWKKQMLQTLCATLSYSGFPYHGYFFIICDPLNYLRIVPSVKFTRCC